MGKPLTPLTKAIQDFGMSPQQFAPEVLGLKYPTFQYRVRQGSLSLEDYHRILFTLGRSFEELFPNPFSGRELPQAPAQVQSEPDITKGAVAIAEQVIAKHRSQALPPRIVFNPSKPISNQDQTSPETNPAISQLPTETNSALPQGTEAQSKEQKKEGVSSTPSAPGFKALSVDIPVQDTSARDNKEELPKWKLPDDVAEVEPPH